MLLSLGQLKKMKNEQEANRPTEQACQMLIDEEMPM